MHNSLNFSYNSSLLSMSAAISLNIYVFIPKNIFRQTCFLSFSVHLEENTKISISLIILLSVSYKSISSIETISLSCQKSFNILICSSLTFHVAIIGFPLFINFAWIKNYIAIYFFTTYTEAFFPLTKVSYLFSTLNFCFDTAASNSFFLAESIISLPLVLSTRLNSKSIST